MRDETVIASIEGGIVTHSAPIPPIIKGQIKTALAEADVEFSEFRLVSNDPEPEQNPRLGELTPEWALWKSRQ